MTKTEQGKKLKVTLTRSPIGVGPKHQAGVRTLGLRRIGHTVTINDHPSIRGVINQISFLLSVEEG
jgi:large subunit ribosomal protein L30